MADCTCDDCIRTVEVTQPASVEVDLGDVTTNDITVTPPPATEVEVDPPAPFEITTVPPPVIEITVFPELNLHAVTHQHGGNDEVGRSTPAANSIPKSDVFSKLDAWISAAAETVAGLLRLATQTEVYTGTVTDAAVSPATLAGLRNVRHIVSSVAGLITDHYVDQTGGASITYTLRVATGSGRPMIVKKLTTNQSGNLTVAANGTDTIDGDPSVLLRNQYQSLMVIDSAPGVWSIV